MGRVSRVLMVVAVLGLGACADSGYQQGTRYVPYDAPVGGPNYPYPDWDGDDLDCSDIGVPVMVDGDDPHDLDDDDGDAMTCD